MKLIYITFLFLLTALLVSSEEAQSKDLDYDDDDLGRKHKKRKKHQNNGPCGYGGFGKTFGEKLFGSQEYTYVSAPVTNYYFGCGGPVAQAPIAQYPIPVNYNQQFGGHGGHSHGGHGGHGGHGHGGHGGHGHGGHGGHGHGGHGGYGSYGGLGFQGFGGQGYGGNFGHYNQPYSQYGPGQYQRPFQNVVSAAASGFGSALADYFSRPRKTQKYINKQVNQFLRPLNKLI